MSEPTFQIPKDVIQPIIDAHVKTAIITALDGKDRLIEDAVKWVLFMKVDSEGKPSSYSSSISFIQWVMQTCVRKAVKDAIEENMGKHKEEIKKAIAKEISNARTSPLAKQLINGMVEAMTAPEVLKYRIKVEYGS
jgi:hypothetical protein